jgi:excinuclease ABC subunit C
MPISDEFLRDLPTSPGVYLMQDRRGKVLYVGKAANLRNRVRSYFVKGGDERLKVRFLIQRVDDIRVILTDTEKEALILENNLIKQHRPPYNVDLRDDKSFFSLRLNVSHPFPRLTLVRTLRIKPDGERYFGPYSSVRDARVTLKFILRLFPLRQCTDRHMATCKRPCLNCQMRRCLCPCTGRVPREEYRRMVDKVTLLLQGKSDEVVKDIRHEMEDAAHQLRFEEAARLRDQLRSVERTLEAQSVSFFHFKDQDVVGIVSDQKDRFAVEFLSFRRGNLLSRESFMIKNPALEEDEVLASAIVQYYTSAAYVPGEVLLSRSVEQPDLIESWLSEVRGAKVHVRIPARGQGTRLIALALKNAADALLRETEKQSPDRAMITITHRLHLNGPPRVIEGYDISNIAGSDPVGVKISFRDGKPDKTGYRFFKMEGFSDQDDPGMIYQTMVRGRGHRDEDPLPDLFLIDGGKSQLNAATQALRDTLGEEFPAIAAIAKARADDDQERFFLPNRKNPVLFPERDPGLMLLMRVRDESHRFAHAFHAKRRGMALSRSALDDVPGIGPKKRSALLKAFGSLKGLLARPDSEIMGVSGISERDVQRIREHFPAGPEENVGKR